MSRRELWVSILLVGAVALVVRLLAAGPVVFPIPEDTAYYVMVARNLSEGHGLVSDAIWSYQTPPLAFPRPAFEVWLPLPSLIVAGISTVLGTGFAAAQLMPAAAGAVVAVMTWRIADDVAAERGLPAGRRRTLGLGSGLTAAVYLPLVLHSVLPDSTMLFAALALPALWLMPRSASEPGHGSAATGRLVAIGLLLGFGALTRNEAIWLALTWVIVVLAAAPRPWAERLRRIVIVGGVALVVFLPWAVRDWLVFGNPLPGQALANALSVSGFDIFAWSDPPTLSRYLGQGLGFMVSSRVDGFVHNLVSVLLYLGVPVSFIGLGGLPWTLRSRSLAPLLLYSALAFVTTTLLFPVATTWGTFLHAAGPVQVLLVISALLALDAVIVRVGRLRGWTRPVAWLGPALGIFASAVFTVIYLPAFGAQSADVQARYAAIEAAFAANGTPIDTVGPVITDFPIWLADATGASALALPDESPDSVVSLARAFPGTRFLLLSGEHGAWPGILETGGAGADCFTPVSLPVPVGSAKAYGDTQVWRIGCP